MDEKTKKYVALQKDDGDEYIKRVKKMSKSEAAKTRAELEYAIVNCDKVGILMTVVAVLLAWLSVVGIGKLSEVALPLVLLAIICVALGIAECVCMNKKAMYTQALRYLNSSKKK